MLNRFHGFFVNLVHDDENDPQETLVEYLQGFSLERRVECLRYLMVEYENRQLDALHKFRYENDTFMWLPSTPDELQDGRGTIDNTVEKVRATLEKYVPEALIKAEMQLASIPASYSSPLQQAKSILGLVEGTAAPTQFAVQSAVSLSSDNAPQYGKKEIEDLPHKDAAAFLKISPSTLHKRKDVVKHYKRPNSNTKWYKIKDLEEYANKAYSEENSTQVDFIKPSQPVRHTRKRKG